MYKAFLVSVFFLAFGYYYQFRFSSIPHTKPILDDMSISRHVVKRVFAVEQSEVCVLSTNHWVAD